MTGMSRSISTTSGCSFAACTTASSPLDASPTISKSSSRPRTIFSPCLTTTWSSTSRTRMGAGGLDGSLAIWLHATAAPTLQSSSIRCKYFSSLFMRKPGRQRPTVSHRLRTGTHRSSKRETRMKRNGYFGQGKGSGSTFGLILIGLGALLLLSNLGIIGGMGGVIGLLILGGIGAWLLNQYYTSRQRHQWLLFSGFTILGAAAATVTGDYAGIWFLALTGFGFLTAWRENDSYWWALIPAGTMFTLAGVVFAEQSIGWLDGGVVFFLGMALTYLVIYSLPRHAQSWALFPAAASAALALVVWGASGSWRLPLLLIGAGLYLMRGTDSFTGCTGGTPTDPQPGSGAAGQARDDDAAEPGRQAAPGAETAPRQLPDRLSGAGPDLPDNWPGQQGGRS